MDSVDATGGPGGMVRAAVGDRDRVVDTVVTAFRADPAFRFFFPDEAAYDRQAAAFAGHLFDRRVRRGTVWIVEGGAAVTMWDAPGEDAYATAGSARLTPRQRPSHGADPVSTLDLPPDCRARLENFDAVVGAALPTSPFWYLGVVATHPHQAGRRWGRSLMATGLQRAAADGLPAYLETANPRNVDLYRGVGWEVVASVDPGLPVWIMRHPGTAGADTT